MEQDIVLEFIERRFSNDCNWTTGNCYYFALILKDRFPKGKVFYDVIYGHFVFEYCEKLYDWTGISNISSVDGVLIEWEKFDEYDSLLKERIVRDCVM